MQLIVNPSCGFYVYWSMYFAFSQWFCALLLHAYKQCVVHVAVRKKFNVPNDIMHFVFGSDGTEFDDLGLMCSKQLLRQIMYDDVGKWGTAGGWHRYSGVSLLICKILYFEPEVHMPCYQWVGLKNEHARLAYWPRQYNSWVCPPVSCTLLFL